MTTVRRIRPLAAGIAMGLMLVACSSGPSNALVVDEDSAAPADYEYVIPQGTSERIRGGEPIAILPAELEVHVGEIIRIINQDDVGHFIGIFYVGPREVVTQRFASPGTFIGNCTVHPSGQISLRVLE